jgi:hypothetical protein
MRKTLDKKTFSSSSEMSGGGEDDDSVSTDEDLVVTTTRTTGIMTRTGQQRRVQRHRNLSPDEDEDDDNKHEHEYRQVQEAKTQHRRRNKLKRLKKRREQVKTKKEEFENKHELELNYSSDFQPPYWLTRTTAQCSPYMPQIGDIVMYFIQGHELYINEVKEKKMYDIDEKTLPWNKCESIDVRIEEFEFVFNIEIFLGCGMCNDNWCIDKFF